MSWFAVRVSVPDGRPREPVLAALVAAGASAVQEGEHELVTHTSRLISELID